MKIILALLLLIPSVAIGGLLDDLPDLQGKTVIYAGEFEKLTCPINGRYDCSKWPMELLKTKSGREYCLQPSSFTSCMYTCKGIIAVGNTGTAYLYVFESLGNDAKKINFQSFQCPSLF